MLKLNLSRGVAAGSIAALLIVSASARAAEDPKVAAEVMAMARAQWAAEIAGAPAAQQNSSLAEDYTEFNPQLPTLVVGKSMADAITAVDPGDSAIYSDMQNPRVQVYGDTAILTYNFAGMRRDKAGKVTPSLAKSTRVYVRQGGNWKLVHANFAPVGNSQ
jgi:ketosteroid isomerase-like protein